VGAVGVGTGADGDGKSEIPNPESSIDHRGIGDWRLGIFVLGIGEGSGRWKPLGA
jgi:hypothetical protein